jgi:N-hydroxyarylamine O-acetyltransferase
MCRIPFENLSKLYYKKHNGLRTLPAVERFLEGVEKYNLGGTCFANNYYFYRLLTDLGYQTKLCGAKMSHPNAHLVSVVDLENRQYLIDVGYAAPFLQPLPLDLKEDFIIQSGSDSYLLKPRNKTGQSQLELYRDGKLHHGYLMCPEPQSIEDFESTITDSYRDEAAFMNEILMARFFPDRSLFIRDMTFIQHSGSESTVRALSNRSELAQAVTGYFGIPARFTNDLPTSCC